LLETTQPFADAFVASLYDAFPFDADLALYRELASETGGRVLEAACGTGRVLVPLALAGFSVVGLDVSAEMLSLARAKLAGAEDGARGRGRLVEADMRSFDLGEQFDLAVVAAKSFAHLTGRADQEAALRSIARHVRAGGLVALDLLHPSPEWLRDPPGSLRQDLCERIDDGAVVIRTETVVSTDLAQQVRVIRSAYELVSPDGSVTKRLVEWPYRWTYRFEAEHLLERAGFAVEALYGGYGREPFTSASPTMVMIARRLG
jgi:SAM-dependent methyltransferase